MRLIDADKLMDALRGNVMIDVTCELEDTVSEQPTICDASNIPDGMTFIFDEEMGTLYEVEADVWAKIKGGTEIKIK